MLNIRLYIIISVFLYFKKVNIQMNLSLEDNYQENSTIDKDEYIKSLEISIQLLQREIETLRKKLIDISSNELKDTQSNSILNSNNDLLNKANSIPELISKLNSVLQNNKIILEWQLLYILNDYSFELIDVSTKNDKMMEEFNQLVEDGVTDWILSNDEIKFAPSLIDSTDRNTVFNIFIPIKNKGSQSILFFGKTIEDINDITDEFKNNLKQIFNFVCLKIDNIISSEHISKISNKLEKNNLNKPKSNNPLIKLAISEIDQPIRLIDANLNFIESGIGNVKRRTEIIKDNLNIINQLRNKLMNLIDDNINNVAEFDVSDFIDDIKFLTNNQLQRDGINLKVTSKNTFSLKFDKKRIESLFTKLILFSADMMPEGGVLSLSYEEKKNYFMFKFYYENALLTNEEFEKIKLNIQPEEINNGLFKNLKQILNSIEENQIEIDLINDTKIGTTFSIIINKFN